ncbi:MAG: hypothetical protein M3542_01165 [Acidobacteriota bacterium]|nr:hypothetical protein [Acidobacteriota bacterium]MDQ5873228.1 hypothetical protein [Acidobacteriota bacterium]
MPRYWWQCTSCGDRPAWLAVCRSRSVAAFIWDELAPSGWDQRLLRRRCKCKRESLRITYRFGRGDPDRISVNRIVGLDPDGDHLPMLWETFRHSSPRTKWIDFKYQRGRNPWGLTKRLILKKPQLVRLLRAYERAVSRAIASTRARR